MKQLNYETCSRKDLIAVIESYRAKEKNFFGNHWSLDDVTGMAWQDKGIALTEDQARTIADNINRYHDANFGITWETLEEAINQFLAEEKK